MRAFFLFPLLLQAWASRIVLPSDPQSALQLDKADEHALEGLHGNASVDPVVTTGVAVSLLFATVGSVLNEATICEAQNALSQLQEVEYRLFELRATHCVQAWKLHYHIAFTQLSLSASLDVVLPPPDMQRGIEVETDLPSVDTDTPSWSSLEREAAALPDLFGFADGGIVNTRSLGGPVQTFTGVLDASLQAIMSKMDDLVVDVCHGAGEAEQTLHAAEDDLSKVLEKARKHRVDAFLQVVHMGLKMVGQLSHIWQDFEKADALSDADEGEKPWKDSVLSLQNVKLWSLIKAAQADLKAKESVHKGFQKALLDNTLVLLKALALTVVIPAKALGLKESVHVIKAFSTMLALVQDFRKLGSGKGELLPKVTKLLYHATGEVEAILKIFEPKLVKSPAGVALIQAHVCLLTINELLMMLDAIQSKKEVHLLAKRAEQLEASALSDFERRVLHEDALEMQRIQRSLEKRQALISRMRAAVIQKVGGAEPSPESVNLKLLELLKPFCSSSVQYCAMLLSTEMFRRVTSADENFRAFSDSALALAATRPVSEVVAVTREHQALSLMRLGFIDGGHWMPGVEIHGSTHLSPRFLFCRGCGRLDISSIELGPVASSPERGVFALPLIVPEVPTLALLARRQSPADEDHDDQEDKSDMLMKVEVVSLMLETADQQLTSDLDDTVAHFAARDTAGLHSRAVCTGTASHSGGSVVRTIGRMLMGDTLPADDFPWYMSSVLIATTGQGDISEEASAASLGPFHYLTITRGWECALRANEPAGWTRLAPAALPRFTSQRASIRTDLWLHRQAGSMPEEQFASGGSVARLRKFLGRQLRASLEASLEAESPSYTLPADMGEARRVVRGMAEDLLQNRPGCWVAEQVPLADGIWNAVVRLRGEGPPDGKKEWKVAAEFDVYTEDEDGYFPTVEPAVVWYSRAHTGPVLYGSPSDAMDAQAGKLRELGESVGAKAVC